MVFAAPLFLMSQTRRFRGFYLANQQAFINISFGLSISYLGLGLLAKMVRVIFRPQCHYIQLGKINGSSLS